MKRTKSKNLPYFIHTINDHIMLKSTILLFQIKLLTSISKNLLFPILKYFFIFILYIHTTYIYINCFHFGLLEKKTDKNFFV